MSIIELSQLGQDLFDFSDLTWAHPLTHPTTHRWGCLHKSEVFKQNQVISISSSFIKLAIWPDPTHSPTHSPIHPPIGGGVSIYHKSLQNWIISIKSRFIRYLAIWPDPTHWLNHPSSQLLMHPPMSGGVSTNCKSSNRIELSQLCPDLLNC